MNSDFGYKHLLAKTNFADGTSIERYALHLQGMTFRDVLNLGIQPDECDAKNYGSKQYKGGMGNLLEERYFGYKSNSDNRADFPEAGVELKATCFDIRKKDQKPVAGERLVLSMIPYDRPIDTDFFTSHLWKKCRQMLLVYYMRDRSIEKYDQRIEYVKLFTPSDEDLAIIKHDYETIVSYIQAGKAHELSEGLTTYLGAATKGATEAKSWVDQYYPTIEPDGNRSIRKAKKRAFSLKRQYMDYVLHHYILCDDQETEAVVTAADLVHETLEQHIQRLIDNHVGKSDKEIAAEYDLTYTGGKAQWTTLVYRMLGISCNRVEEFIKAGISVRAIRIEQTGSIKESMSFAPFEFADLMNETWDESAFKSYLDETRFFFVVFKHEGDVYRLKGCCFWNIPVSDIEGEARRCWDETRDIIARGVTFTVRPQKNGTLHIMNNLPGSSSNRIAHVRPHAQRAAYLLKDGTSIGDIHKDASQLPDGQWMTKQSFWFDNSYVLSALRESNAGLVM